MADPTKPDSAPDGRIDRAATPGAIVPPDPPMASSLTDAEAGGASPSAMQREVDPDAGPRTANAYPPSEAEAQPVETRRSVMTGVWVLVGLATVVILIVLVWISRSV